MFESIRHLDSAREALRAERAATARRLIGLGHYARERMVELGNTHEDWVVDDWEMVAVEVAAELGIGRKRASTEMAHGQTLLERLPRLAEVFLAGDLEYGHFTAIVARTALITDSDVLTVLDEQIAAAAPGWCARSRDWVAEQVDWMVLDVDPEAVRVAKQRRLDRHIEIQPADNGLADVYGSIDAADAAVVDKRLNQIADTVCSADPRTFAQRRADALRVLSEGRHPAALSVWVTGVSRRGCRRPGRWHRHPCGGRTVDPRWHRGHPGSGARLRDRSRRAGARHGAAGAVPAGRRRGEPDGRAGLSALGQAGRFRALLRPDLPVAGLRCAGRTGRYRPHHPWPYGPTHPSNTKLYCRVHHLVKTFCPGWTDTQGPDGSVTVISPAGRIYQTKPDGALFFPAMAAPTTELSPAAAPPPTATRGLAMPTRARTRAQARTYRIAHERALNRAAAEADPPPV